MSVYSMNHSEKMCILDFLHLETTTMLTALLWLFLYLVWRLLRVVLYSNILVDSNCYGVILCRFLSLWLLAFQKIRTAQDLAVNAFLRDLTVEEYSDFKLKDLTHFGEEEEQIELEVGRSPLIAHELLRNKLYNCFVSSSPSAVNMTSQRKTLENNSRKLRRLLRK